MTTTLVASAFAAFAVGVAAQTPQQNPPSQTPTTQSPTTQNPTSESESGMQHGNRTVTLTGCLREGDTADTFKLDDVQWKGRTGSSMTTEPNESSATGTSGSSSQSASQASQSVTLKSSSDVDLKQHVGQKIQVSGTLSRAVGTTGESNPSMNPPSSNPANPTPETNPSSESSMSQSHGNRTVNVTTVKMLSETCGG
ncbi:MAG TPA: hypothetical protein VFX12_11170 [Vicinamibacterales bacterium]|nr:hypothetical protein [Vicinamibacterales bacterium]